jgi:hypothetical protein
LLAGGNRRDVMNARDADGATPLMAAVLTGRLAIARLLLRNGASSGARDRRGRKALEYSRASSMKKRLRTYERLGLPPVTNKQIHKRKAIAKILRYPAALASWSVPDSLLPFIFLSSIIRGYVTNVKSLSSRRARKHECSHAIFYKKGRDLHLMKPDVTFKIGKENLERATSGFIASATRPEVKTAAASGWQSNPTRGQDVLDNSKYIQLVQELARVLDFELVRSQHDNNGKHLPEHAGRFVASHAVSGD